MNCFQLKFIPKPVFLTKSIPLTINNVASGTINIRKNSITKLMDFGPYRPPKPPVNSNVYVFEKDVPVGQNKFVILIDVFTDTFDYLLPDMKTITEFITDGPPPFFQSPVGHEGPVNPSKVEKEEYLKKLHRWKCEYSANVLSRYKSTVEITDANFNSIVSCRMIPWTDPEFACYIERVPS